MTALATGLALLPIVIGGNKPVHEIEYPLALMPVLYLRFGILRKPSLSTNLR